MKIKGLAVNPIDQPSPIQQTDESPSLFARQEQKFARQLTKGKADVQLDLDQIDKENKNADEKKKIKNPWQNKSTLRKESVYGFIFRQMPNIMISEESQKDKALEQKKHNMRQIRQQRRPTKLNSLQPQLREHNSLSKSKDSPVKPSRLNSEQQKKYELIRARTKRLNVADDVSFTHLD